VTADLRDAHASELRDLLGGETCPHLRLDLARRHRACVGGPQLLEVRAVAAYGRAQRLVDPQREACAVRRGEHEVLAVVGKSDELELCHEVPPTFSHPYRAIREPVERGGGPVRRERAGCWVLRE